MRVLLIATNRYDRCMSRMQAQPLPIGLAYLLAPSPPHRTPSKPWT
jgi:hypothetical protein